MTTPPHRARCHDREAAEHKGRVLSSSLLPGSGRRYRLRYQEHLVLPHQGRYRYFRNIAALGLRVLSGYRLIFIDRREFRFNLYHQI